MITDTHKQLLRHWPARVLALTVMGVILMPMTTRAQDRSVQPLIDRLDRLERDIRTLNLQNSRGESAPLTSSAALDSPPAGGSTLSNAGFARINERLSAMEGDLRTVTGRGEEMAHQLDAIEQRLDKLVSDIDYRLSTLERSASVAPNGQGGGVSPSAAVDPALGPVQSLAPLGARTSGTLGTIPQEDLEAFQSTRGVAEATPSPVAAADPQAAAQVAAVHSVLPQGTPQEQYAFARSFLFKQQYEEAEKALGQFIEAHPSHALTGNARYWLGETFYVRDNFARAAAVFLEGFQKEPRGSKAPDTLLKLGMSLTNLEKAKEACAAFNKLRTEFPDASPNIRDIAARERERARCS